MPDLAGFIQFIRSSMKVSEGELPSDDPSIRYCFDLSLVWVNQQIACISPLLYSQAVYNLAASFLANYGPDDTFEALRNKYGLNNFTAGVISASSDETTSQTRAVGDALKNLTISDLQRLKDPWGRVYLEIAQQYGDLWGLS